MIFNMDYILNFFPTKSGETLGIDRTCATYTSLMDLLMYNDHNIPGYAPLNNL